MDLVTALILIGGGLVAGFVNTVAGGGSVVTLPILIELVGLPATVANGTKPHGNINFPTSGPIAVICPSAIVMSACSLTPCPIRCAPCASASEINSRSGGSEAWIVMLRCRSRATARSVSLRVRLRMVRPSQVPSSVTP